MEKGLAMRETYRLDEWRRIVADHQCSGQSVKEYCTSIGVAPNSYYYYLRKIRNLVAADPRLVAVNFGKVEQNPSIVSINYHDATIQIAANDETSLCAVLSALKKV